MPYLTTDDFSEAYSKLRQRGLSFLASKFSWAAQARTRSAFDDVGLQAANWWIIPAVRQRWNQLITGDPDLPYEPYFMQQHLDGKTGLRLLSLGSGICSHELTFAQSPHFDRVVCVDIAGNLLKAAQAKAAQLGLQNMAFMEADLYQMDWPEGHYDVVLFHASLHHFEAVESLIRDKIKPVLRNGGLLLINEYVGPNRLQFPPVQIQAINEALRLIPAAYRRRFKTNVLKQRVSGPGLWRMILADPSECVDSAAIIPALHRHFEVLQERSYGGNLLMLALKDIAHHFVDPEPEARAALQRLFTSEDAYLQNHDSDFIYGVYRKNA
ncbi:MAG: methyltransferase domain-containing protein [Phaeodactylibacter sp.]|uniref:class I SAM-dependent methyltransferase n=1 Tax=Phaeodactylibacter sp. TaxID=1940289 RepID=UPI0032F072E1